jgi:hypothetical protein
MPTKTSAGPNEVVRLEVLRLPPPLRPAGNHPLFFTPLLGIPHAQGIEKKSSGSPLGAWGGEVSSFFYFVLLLLWLKSDRRRQQPLPVAVILPIRPQGRTHLQTRRHDQPLQGIRQGPSPSPSPLHGIRQGPPHLPPPGRAVLAPPAHRPTARGGQPEGLCGGAGFDCDVLRPVIYPRGRIRGFAAAPFRVSGRPPFRPAPGRKGLGWKKPQSRRAADTATEASWRSHASGSGDGGGLGGDSSWGAGYGGDVGRADRQ